MSAKHYFTNLLHHSLNDSAALVPEGLVARQVYLAHGVFI